jgi:hypothetical protein
MAADPRWLREQSGGELVAELQQRRRAATKKLPEDCPFEPVGVFDGAYFVIDANRQLRELRPRDMSRNGISSLCGDCQAWLLRHYPRERRHGPPDSFRPEAVADDLMAACSLMGVWSPEDKVRGRGWWLALDGDLVVHLGDKLLIRGKLAPCGRRGEHVYDVRDRLPRPATQPQPAGAGGPGYELLDRLQPFHLRRGDLDRRLLLGWVCAAIVAGALSFRPHLFLTGERGTGKSAVLAMLEALLGAMLVTAADTTAAGIYQALKYDVLALLLDELENDPDPQKVQSILRMARIASTGGKLRRGGADHHGQQFVVRSAFLAAAIIMPALRGQDRSRWVQIDVLPHQGVAMVPSTVRLADLGRQLFRRMLDNWERLQREVLPRWRDQLILAGWESRGADLYGTLLACGDVALHDETPADEVQDLIGRLEELRQQHKGDEPPEWRGCSDHLMAQPHDPYRRGERQQIGALMLQGTGYGRGEVAAEGLVDGSRRSVGEATRYAQTDHNAGDALNALALVGIRILPGAFRHLEDRRGVAIANNHPALIEIFKSTHWAGIHGATGPWRQALLRAPDAYETQGTIRFRGKVSRAVVVPLQAMLAGLVGSEEGEVFRDESLRELYRPDDAVDPGDLH